MCFPGFFFFKPGCYSLCYCWQQNGYSESSRRARTAEFDRLHMCGLIRVNRGSDLPQNGRARRSDHLHIHSPSFRPAKRTIARHNYWTSIFKHGSSLVKSQMSRSDRGNEYIKIYELQTWKNPGAVTAWCPPRTYSVFLSLPRWGERVRLSSSAAYIGGRRPGGGGGGSGRATSPRGSAQGRENQGTRTPK